MADKKHGGKRAGAGSKPLYDEKMRGLTIMLTVEQRATLDKIGGAQAVRDWLDQKKRPQPMTEAGE